MPAGNHKRKSARTPPKKSKPVFQKLFKFFSVDFNSTSRTEAPAEECPFCGKPNFSVNLETGLYQCLSANTCGEKGNALTFVRYCYGEALAATTDDQRRILAADRGLTMQSITRHGLAYYADQDTWLIPFKNAAGEVMTCLRYRTEDGSRFTLPGLEQQLFGVDRLYMKPEKTLFVVEGPWDAIALDTHIGKKKNRKRYEVLAVPSANIFKDRWCRFLEKRKEVRICFDNDKAGRDGQQRIIEKCKELGLKINLRTLKWPEGFEEKSDIRDLVDAGENVIEFTRQNCQKVSTASQPLSFMRGDEVEHEPVEWLWPGRIPFGKFVSLSGPNGSQKSTICKDIAARCTAGLPMPVCKKRLDPFDVIYFTSEDSQSTVADLVKLHHGHVSRLHIHDLAETDNHIEVIERIDDLESTINSMGVRLVILDALNSFVAGDISTDSKARRTVSGPLHRLARRTGACIIGIRNWGRTEVGSASNRSLGSHSLSDLARCVLNTNVVPPTGDFREKRLFLEWEKVSDGRDPTALEYSVKDLSKGESDSHRRRIVWNKTKEQYTELAASLRVHLKKKGSQKR